MGSGKTSWAIQYINTHPDESFIYCTPYLSEINRIKEVSDRHFYDPQFRNGRKLDDFNMLLMEGKDIALTHSTFSHSDDETLNFLSKGNYCLFLDEALDIIVNYNEVCSEERKLKSNDVDLLIEEQFIKIDKYGKVSWQKKSYPDAKYADVERLAKKGYLYYLDRTMLVWQFSPEIFKKFKKVYVLTYLFKGSTLKPYFEYHSLTYHMAQIAHDGDKYYLAEYKTDTEQRKQYKDLIHIYSNEKMNNYKQQSLSKRWFERAQKQGLKPLHDNIFNYFHNVMKVKSKDIMWTCPKAYQKFLKGRGYNIVRSLTDEEREKLTKKEKKELETKLSCFVPCNAKATNDFATRSVLAYAINMYPNPYIKRYFENKNIIDGTNIQMDEDYFALSCLLQWIWRSQIRNGKPINIYIPSTRMRHLLQMWLDGKM